MNINDKIKQYLKLKQTKKELEKLLEAKIKPYKDAMKKLELEMLDYLNKEGLDSAPTAYGTAYTSLIKTLAIKDGKLVMDFIEKNNAIDLLQRHINKTVYEQYIDDGIDIPGIEVTTRLNLNVRKN